MRKSRLSSMSVLTFKSDEFKTFPPVLREYASYVAAIKGNSEKTVCEYLLDLRTFFRFCRMTEAGETFTQEEFENISIRDLTLDDVRRVKMQDIVDFLMFAGFQRENNTTTRMRKLSALRSFFGYMHGKRHFIDSDPTADVEGPKKHRALPKFLTYDECVSLLETVRSDTESRTTVRDYAIICLFLNTGMRLSELVGLNLDSFDPDVSVVKVLGKGNKERMIYLNHAAQDAVREYLRVRLDPKHVHTGDNALFLSGREQRISVKTVQWLVYRYLDMAGLGRQGYSVHKLRHTAATLMYQSGKVDIRVLKDVLGHEQLNTTQIYTHLVDKNLENAMDSNPLADLKIRRPHRGDDDR